MKNGIKTAAVLLFSAVTFLSSAVMVSAAGDGSHSTGTSVKMTVLTGEAPAEGSDVNGDGTVNVLDLMRSKYNKLNPADPETETGKFVYRLYRNIWCTVPDVAEAEKYTARLEKGEISLEELVFEFAENEKLAAAATGDAEFVKSVYTGLLERDPSEEELKEASESLAGGADKSDLVRKIAASEGFITAWEPHGLGDHLKRIGSNYKKDGKWMHLEPSGKTYPVTDETLLRVLDSCSNILKDHGNGVDDIYKFCVDDSGYKFMEKTKTLEEIENIGWTYFADYALTHYFSVCYYMAAEMDVLLEQAGYQCRVVHATHGSGDHYWNQIYINGQWTNYDVTNCWSNYTWDQMVEAGAYILLGYVRPEYK
ncbi:MAG: hypothetical protein J5864_03765 [Oscillospiraceae bacterium]|nr:hypothetical protein [Oscillospiraceae bacterium]